MTQTKALVAQSTSLDIQDIQDIQEIQLPPKQLAPKQEILPALVLTPVAPKKVVKPLSLADRLYSIACELDMLESECDPNNRGYIFQLRTSLLTVAALEAKKA